MIDKPPFHVCLFEPLIPQNTGNIGRLTTANGLPLHLIEPLGFDLSEKAVRRAGLDYWKHADVRVHKDFEAFRRSLPEARLVAFTKFASQRYCDFRFERGDVLLFGKETKGLPEPIREREDVHCVRLPMSNTDVVRSLNLANAVAIGSYEALRQLDFPQP